MNAYTYTKKIIRYCVYTALSLCAFTIFLIGTFFVLMRFDFAANRVRDYIQTDVNALLAPYATHVEIEGLTMNLPFSLTVQDITLNDAQGGFASIRNSVITCDFFALFSYAIVIQDISLQELRFTRIPHLNLSQQIPALIQEKTLLSQMETSLNTITPLLFHAYMPTLRIEKIYIHALAEAGLVKELSNQIRMQDPSDNRPGSTPMPPFQDIILTTTLHADLNAERLRMKSNLSVSMPPPRHSQPLPDTSMTAPKAMQVSMTAPKAMQVSMSLDFLPDKQLQTRIDVQDEDAISLRIAKEIFDLPPSKKAHARFSLQGAGFLKAFQMNYEGNIFDDAFMKAPALAKGTVQIFPLLANIDLSVQPAVQGIIDAGIFSLKAEAKIETSEAENIPNTDPSSLAQNTKQIDHTMNVNYTLSSRDVHFTQTSLQGLFGKEQHSQGYVDIILSPHTLPRIETDTIVFKAKGLYASAKARIARNVDIQIHASLPDLSVLSTEQQTMQGNVQANIAITGPLNALSLHTSLSVPTLDMRVLIPTIPLPLKIATQTKVAKVAKLPLAKPTATKSTTTKDLKTPTRTPTKATTQPVTQVNTQNDKNIRLDALLFTLQSEKNKAPSKGTEKLLNKNAFTIEEASYLATIQRFRKLLAENTQQMYSLLVDFSAQYNQEPLQMHSRLVFSRAILDEQTTNPRRIYANDISFKGLGGEIAGNIDFTWDAIGSMASDLTKIPLIRGTIKGTLQDSQRLTQIIDMPLQIKKMQFTGNFSTHKALTNKPVGVTNEAYSKLISYITHASEQKIAFQFSAASLGYDNLALHQVHANISVDNIWFFPTITTQADVKTLQFGQVTGKDYTLKLDGSLKNLQIQTSLQGDVLFDFVGNMVWDRTKQDFALDMTRLSLQYPAINMDVRLEQKAQIRLSSKEFAAKTVELFVAPKGKITLDGVLRSELLSLHARWQDIDLATFPVNHKGILEGSLSFEGSSKKPIGIFEARAYNLQTPRMPPISLELKGSVIAGNPIHRLAVEIGIMDKKKFGARKTYAHIGIPLESTPFLRIARNIPLEGTLVYDGSIASLWQYLPIEGRRLSGILQIDGEVSGDITRPLISLKADIKKARYEDIITGILIEDIAMHVLLGKDGKGSVNFSGADGKAGTIQLKGTVEIPALMSGEYKAPVAPAALLTLAGKKPNAKELRAIKLRAQSLALLDLTGKLENFQPLQRTDLQVELSGDLQVQGMLEDPNITGHLAIKKGALNLQNISTASIPKLNIVEDASIRRKKQVRNIGNVNLQISIPDTFLVYAATLSTEWQGGLTIKGKLPSPTLAGTLSAVRGDITLFGKEFTLSKGSVHFDGSDRIAPLIDVQLNYASQGLDALISLSGTATAPHLELSSVPYLPQDEVLAHILFGASLDKLSAFEKIQLATALTRLAGFSLSAGLADVGRSFLGLDVFRVGKDDSDEDEEAYSVEIGKYMNDDIYLGVEQGINSQNTEGIADWRLNNQWSTGTRVGTEETEINLEWKYDY